MKKISNVLSAGWLDNKLQSIYGDYTGKSFKLAYSGGVDSQALLYLLAELRKRKRIQLQALHVNHGLSPMSLQWVEFCRNTCDILDIPLHVEQVTIASDTNLGIEGAARGARYDALSGNLHPGEILITAHNLNDQAETFLLQLMRGSGSTGLSAMLPDRQFADGRLCRPLLSATREQIVAFANSRNLDWIDDESNADLRFRRNYLRHQVMPKFTEVWPNALQAIVHSAANLREANTLLRQLAEIDYRQAKIGKCSALSVVFLENMAEERRTNLLRYWIQTQHMPAPNRRQLKQMHAMICRHSQSAQARVQWGGQSCRRYRNSLWLTVDRRYKIDTMSEYDWNISNQDAIYIGENRLSASTVVGSGIAKNLIKDAAVVRFRRGGERLRLPQHAHHSSLKNLYQQAGIPPWEREIMPLIYVNGELAAIGDRWVGDSFAAATSEPGWKLQWSVS